jgi:hypothetical protein
MRKSTLAAYATTAKFNRRTALDLVCLAKRLDLPTRQLQHAGEGILLGKCQFRKGR